MARNKKSTFSFGADDGLDFATLNESNTKNGAPEIITKSTTETHKDIQETSNQEKSDNVKEIPLQTLSDNVKDTTVENLSNNVKKIDQPANTRSESKDCTKDLSDNITTDKNEHNFEYSNTENEKSYITVENEIANKSLRDNNITELRNNDNSFYKINPNIPIKEQNIQYKQDNCKPRVATILDEYMRYVRVKSKKLGIPLNLYINIIIDDYKSNIININDENRYAELYTELSRQYKGSKLRTNFFLIPENADFIEDEITNIGCQPSQYFNHIINLEIQREKEFGPRI